MCLPPELIDKILDHPPPNEPQTLRNCSLVARSWVNPDHSLLRSHSPRPELVVAHRKAKVATGRYWRPTLPLGLIYGMLVDYRRNAHLNEYMRTFREARRTRATLSGYTQHKTRPPASYYRNPDV